MPNIRETLAAKVRAIPRLRHAAQYSWGWGEGTEAAANLIAESPELADLEARNAKLREACEAALRIKKLWLPPPPSKCLPEHENEAVALIAMHDKLTAALAGEGL